MGLFAELRPTSENFRLRTLTAIGGGVSTVDKLLSAVELLLLLTAFTRLSTLSVFGTVGGSTGVGVSAVFVGVNVEMFSDKLFLSSSSISLSSSLIEF